MKIPPAPANKPRKSETEPNPTVGHPTRKLEPPPNTPHKTVDNAPEKSTQPIRMRLPGQATRTLHA